MELTLAHIAELHKELNRKYFNGELTTPNFGFAKSRTFCGQFCYSKRLLRISTCYNWTEEHLRHTVCHEMIHQWQHETGKFGDWHKDRGHGYWFKCKAYDIYRADRTLNIMRCHNMTAYGHHLEATPSTTPSKTLGKILVLDFYGVRGAVKVTPANATRLKYFENKYKGVYYSYSGIALDKIPTPRSNACSMNYHRISNAEWEKIKPYLTAL